MAIECWRHSWLDPPENGADAPEHVGKIIIQRLTDTLINEHLQ
jgi:hypothetical protein